MCDNYSFYTTCVDNFGPLSVKPMLSSDSSTMYTVSLTLYICGSSQALLLDLVRSKVRQISWKVLRDLLVERVFHIISSWMGVAILFMNGLGVNWIINMPLSSWYGWFLNAWLRVQSSYCGNIVCIGVWTPTQKHYHPLFCQVPLNPNLQKVQVLFFRQFPPIYCFFVNPPPPFKNRIFQWTLIILNFFILNPIPSFKSN